MGQFEIANEIGILSGGRNAEYSDQLTSSSPPLSAAAGVYMQNSILAMVDIFLQEDAAAFQSRLYFTDDPIDFTQTYTATIDGNAVIYNAATTPATTNAEALTELAAAINLDATVNLIVLATAIDTDGDGVVDCVRLSNITGASHTTVFATSGASLLAITEDATAAVVNIWMLPGGRGSDKPVKWNVPPGLAAIAVTELGWGDRLVVSSRDRVYVQLVSSTTPSGNDHHIQFTVAPCIIEGDSD